MGLDRFDIILENPTGSFYSGQLVRGAVVFACSSNETVLGLNIICDGKTHVHWTEEHYHRDNTTVIHYRSDEKYFNYDFWPFGNGQDPVTLVAGIYEYPFEFKLPDDVPSSWEGEFGRVRYTIIAIIKNKWISDYTAELTLAVTARADLNLRNDAAKGDEKVTGKSVGSCCCKSGPIVLSFRIPKRGYVPGEFIPFESFIQNVSTREITSIELYLVQYSKFFAGGKTRSHYSEMNKIQRLGIPPKSNDVWNAAIQVPLIPPTDLGGCKIIQVNYYVEMIAHISGVGEGPDAQIDVIIGTIPIGSSRSVSQTLGLVVADTTTEEKAIHPNASTHHHHHKSGKKGKHHNEKEIRA